MSPQAVDPNALSLEIYSGLATTRITDLDKDLAHFDDLYFETFFPGGIFGSAGFSVARDLLRMWLFRQGQRLVIRNGLAVVYEGGITNPGIGNARRSIEAAGYWGVPLLSSRGLKKAWADVRITEDIWTYRTVADGSTGAEKCFSDLNGRLRFTPKAEAWATGEFASRRYDAGFGNTVKRLVYDYDLQEAGQAWEISFWRFTLPATWTQMTDVSGETYNTGTTTVIAASGTGSIDVELAGAGNRFVEIRFYARGNQTPPSDGTIYGEISGVEVYSELGSITAAAVAPNTTRGTEP